MSQERGFPPLSLENRLHSLVDLAPGETFIVFGFTESLEGVGQWLIIVCIVVAPRGTSWNCRPVVPGTVHRRREEFSSQPPCSKRSLVKEAWRDKMMYQDQRVACRCSEQWKQVALNLSQSLHSHLGTTSRMSPWTSRWHVHTHYSSFWWKEPRK